MYRRLTVNFILVLVLTASACSSFGSPTPVVDSQGTFSLETRTGIEELDQVLAVVESGDRAGLEGLIQYTTAPCTTQDGLGGPPKCREGEAEGTLIEALPSISSEGSFIRKLEIDSWIGVDASALFAVYRSSEGRIEEEFYPRGEYAIVFITSGSEPAVTLRILDGRIVRVDYPFYQSLGELKSWVEQDASEVILAPNIR
jgi:hypothetical protein